MGKIAGDFSGDGAEPAAAWDAARRFRHGRTVAGRGPLHLSARRGLPGRVWCHAAGFAGVGGWLFRRAAWADLFQRAGGTNRASRAGGRVAGVAG